jgi:glycosyltransferase involved in cell wall biosynthesis
MRVFHLVGQREDNGGVLSVIRNLQEATATQGWTHVVWNHAVYHETRRPALEYRFSRHIRSDSPSHWQLLWGALGAFAEFRKCLRGERFEVVHAHTRGTMLVGMLAASLLRRPVLFTNHNYGRRPSLYRWAARLPDFHTVVLTPNMARHYGLTGWPNVSIVSECCSDRFFSEPLLGRRPASEAKGPIRLVGLGNVVRWKNWHLLLDALSRLSAEERRRIEFHHWGPTPQDHDAPGYDDELRAFIAQHRLQPCVFFRGPSNSINQCLHQADWFALPSTNEPCSVALIEALAMGIPSLVSASGGNVDILRPDRTGLLFEPDNVDDLTAKLRAILWGWVPPAAPAELRESVRCRSATAVAAEYGRLYRRLSPPTGSA